MKRKPINPEDRTEEDFDDALFNTAEDYRKELQWLQDAPKSRQKRRKAQKNLYLRNERDKMELAEKWKKK